MNAPLPPFNLASRCPKCGAEGGGPPRIVDGAMGFARIDTLDPFPVEYHPSTAIGRFPCALQLHGEHLHRTCPRCRFEWVEACLVLAAGLPAAQVDCVRPEVWRFALLMERELARHDDRNGWKTLDKVFLLRQVRVMIDKLAISLDIDYNPPDHGHRAADAANYCMMIADVCGALAEKKP